jgi:hypothetical protein
VLTDKPHPVDGFDFSSYYVKSCTGKINKPANGLVNIISCFGDNRTARKKTEWVAVSKSGKALRTNKIHRFLWDHICPNVDTYRDFLFDLVKQTLKNQVGGIHLDCIGFPRSEYCICKRCLEKRKDANLDWIA